LGKALKGNHVSARMPYEIIQLQQSHRIVVQRLRFLLLHNDLIGPVGAQALAKALQSNTSLAVLHLCDNEIGVRSSRLGDILAAIAGALIGLVSFDRTRVRQRLPKCSRSTPHSPACTSQQANCKLRVRHLFLSTRSEDVNVFAAQMRRT